MGRRPTKTLKRDPYGAWLLFLRREAKLSQEEVSLRLSMIVGKDPGATSVSKWERTGNLAGRDYIPALAEVLGVSIETLLRVEKPKRNRPWHFQGIPKGEYKSGEEQRKSLGKLDIVKLALSSEEYEEFKKKTLKDINPNAR